MRSAAREARVANWLADYQKRVREVVYAYHQQLMKARKGAAAKDKHSVSFPYVAGT